MSVRVVHSLHEKQIHELLTLYHGEWWCKTRTLDDVRAMLLACDLIVGVVDEATSELVAFSRVLSDGVYKAMVFDVIVRPDFRGQGLGDLLMKTIVEHPSLSKVESIELYCLPEMVSFYEKWEFSTDVAGCVFMRRISRPAMSHINSP